MDIFELMELEETEKRESYGSRIITINDDLDDKFLIDLNYKIACVERNKILKVNEFKKSQTQTNFKKLITLFLSDLESGNFEKSLKVMNIINSKFKELKETPLKTTETHEKTINKVKEVETPKQVKKPIKTDVEHMEETFNLQKREPKKRGVK